MNLNDPAISQPLGDACDQIFNTIQKIDGEAERITAMGSSIALLIALAERAYGRQTIAVAVRRGTRDLKAAIERAKKQQ